MTMTFRASARLLLACCLLHMGAVAWAQRPVAPTDANRARRVPTAPPSRSLLPQEREFLELEVDLGQAAPFPAQKPARSSAGKVTPKPESGAPSREISQKTAPATSPEPASPAALSGTIAVGPVKWRQDFESTRRRPIETAVFGRGPRHIAVIGSLSGNSEAALALVDKFAGVLAQHALMPVQLAVLVVRCPNPDGAAERILTNSRGVDLNRNFPSTRFTAVPRPQTGEKPGSETETRALIQLMNEFQPELVIHVVESRSSRGTVRSDDLVPRDLLPNYDSAPYDHVYKSGSLAGYVHETLKRSVVELELPARATSTVDDDALLQLLVTTLDQSTRSLRSQLESHSPIANESGASTKTRATGQVQPDGLRGNVEFLPPPPDAPPEVVKPRYIELPPPPE